MDKLNFFLGFGCGICVGIAFFRIRKLFDKNIDTVPVLKTHMKNTEYKLVMVVRSDLNMGKGRVGAQCGHAAVEAFQKCQNTDIAAFRVWHGSGQAKIALKAPLDEMKKIQEKADKLGIITTPIIDAGNAQFDESNLTVIGVGPAPKHLIDQVTGHLKLL